MNTEEKIKALKNKLRDYDTEDILGNISLSYTTFAVADGVIDHKPYYTTWNGEWSYRKKSHVFSAKW